MKRLIWSILLVLCAAQAVAASVTDSRGSREFAAAPERAVALSWSLAEQLIELGVAAGRKIADEFAMMFGSDQARIYSEAALADGKIVIAAAKFDAPHFDDAQAPSLCAVLDRELFKQHHSVRDGMELQVVLLRGQVVEHHHRAVRLVKKCFSARTWRR